MDPRMLFAIAGLVVATATPGALHAEMEPYLAVRTGLKCSACHVNRTGGGMRNDFGSVFGGTNLPASTAGFQFQNRALNDWLRVGSDFRLTGTYTIPDATPRTALDITRGNVYLEAKLLDQKLTLYFDQTLAPGNVLSREFFALIDWLPANGYAKVGKFFLPSGLRLLDDQEFTRAQTGFTMLAPDQGVEIGFEPGSFSVVASLTNGNSGAAENDDGKQVTGSAAWVTRRFRLGASASRNSKSGVNTDVLGGFGGVSIGPLSFLGEVDFVRGASSEGSDVEELVLFGEGDWLITQGVNAKVTYGYHDRNVDRAEDERTRARFGLEVFPIPYLQLSGFYLLRDDIPETEPLSLPQDDQIIVELHLFF